MSAEEQKLDGKWIFLSGGSDGIDGTSPAAGGIVDAKTLLRIRTMQLSPEDLLEDNNSYCALKAAGDLLLTGATGTNVADLQILLFELDA
jgi:glycerate-2-kinase